MKKNVLLTAAFLMVGLLFGSQVMAQGRIDFGKAKSAQECANVNKDGFTASFSFSGIEAAEVSTEKGVFSNITMEGTYPAGNLGEPSLPTVHKLVAVPFGAQNVTVEVKSYTTTTYRLADYGIKTVMPQQPSVSKSQKPEDVKFVYSDKAYASKSFSHRPVANIAVRGTMRGIQVGSLTVNPINYNPADNSIEVYNDIVVEVSYNDYDKVAAENEFVRTYNHYFASVYKTMFNWRDDVYDEHPDLWQAPVKMLVIADRMFESVMQEWIDWKTTKGFYMDVNYTDEIGNNASSIRSFIQGKYAEDAPTFVIIFGDKEQVPASATGSESHCVTDLQYMSVDNDDFPDIYHSRMCAQTVEQMQNIITKTLLYEQYENLPDPTYLNNVLLIAGWDSQWNPRIGKPTIQYAMEYYYNAEHGFENVYNWLGQPYTGCYEPLTSGVGFANYTAHGSQTSWADPEFNVTNVNNLTNVGKPFLAMGNCCQAADWGYNNTCFGEAMIRANTAAAYAYIGSCPNTYWYEDYYFGVGATSVMNQMPTFEQTAYGVYDAVWDDDVFNTVSAIPFIGNIAVCYSHANGYTGSVSDKYYWQAYHALGDGSVMPFRVQPTANVVSHMSVVPIGMDTYEVNANAGSYVAISKDGVLLGAGLVDQTGSISVNIEPVTSGGEVTICVTHPQHIPYVQVVPAAALEGPYVSVDSYTPKSAHVGDESTMDITFKNVGTAATNGTTTVTLSCADPNLTILNGTGSFESLDPEATIEIAGFTYTIAQGVADGTKFTINMTAVCGSNTWEGKAVITAGEAVLLFESMQWAEAFTPGETVSVVARFKNKGHYMATNVVGTVSTTSNYATIETPSFAVGTVDPNGFATCVFEITIDEACPITEQIALEFTVNADGGLVAEGSGVLKNTCNVVFELRDSWGDGWNGNKLAVSFSDGTPTEELTVNAGNYETFILQIGKGVHVTLSWINGDYSYECSFTVKYENGEVIYEGGAGAHYEFDCNCEGETPTGTFNPVTDLAADVAANSITLTWVAPEGAINYIVSRNGIEIDKVAEPTYIDQIATEGTYAYCVVAEYEGGVSVPECITIEAEWGIGENEAGFSIYPNPVSNTLYVNCGDAEYSYVMFNGMGQQVAAGNGRGTMEINVNDMMKGVYFLRLTSGSQVRVEKVVVE